MISPVSISRRRAACRTTTCLGALDADCAGDGEGRKPGRRRAERAGTAKKLIFVFMATEMIPPPWEGRGGGLDEHSYFCKYRNMTNGPAKKSAEQVTRFADMLSAMGTEARLRIIQLLLSAHPQGLVVGEIQEELEIPSSTLSHHLDKLKNENLVHVKRESTFLRYTANTEALQELMQFLWSECCTRNKALRPRDILEICR